MCVYSFRPHHFSSLIVLSYLGLQKCHSGYFRVTEVSLTLVYSVPVDLCAMDIDAGSNWHLPLLSDGHSIYFSNISPDITLCG